MRARTAGAAIRTTRLTSTRASRAITTLPSITATSRTSTRCRRTPTRSRRADSTTNPSQRTGGGKEGMGLDLRPGNRIVPYLVFDRNPGYGNGVDEFVQDSNDECPVATLLRDSTNNYRGGVDRKS